MVANVLTYCLLLPIKTCVRRLIGSSLLRGIPGCPSICKPIGFCIIIVSEHWLWPFHFKQLQDIHPDYAGFGVADSETSTLNSQEVGDRVGIIWKSQLYQCASSHLADSALFTSASITVYIIGVYLPSCNHSMEEYLSDKCHHIQWPVPS